LDTEEQEKESRQDRAEKVLPGLQEAYSFQGEEVEIFLNGSV